MLAVVEHHEELLGREKLDDAPFECHAGPRVHAQRARDDLRHRVGVVGSGELTEPRTVTEPRQGLGSDLQRKPRLPHTTHTAEGHEARGVERLGDGSQLVVTADERREL